MVTFRVELASAPNRDGQYAVRLRITAQRKHKRISLGFSIYKKDFNPNGTLEKLNWVRASCNQSHTYNNLIKTKIEEHRKVAFEMKSPTIEKVIEAINTPSSSSFIEFYKDKLENIKITHDVNTYKNYKSPLDKIEAYLKSINKKDLLFEDFTSKFLGNLEAYMRQTLSENTTSKYLGSVKTFVNQAIDQNVCKGFESPFKGYKLTETNVMRDKLTIEEIQQLHEVDLSESFVMSSARDIFLFMYYAHGMRIGDALFLKVSNVYASEGNLRVRYIMEKGQKPKDVLLTVQAQKIIEKHIANKRPNAFIFPFIKPDKLVDDPVKIEKYKQSLTALVNKYLKKIAEKLEWTKKLSNHIARHSFADGARRRGANVYAISKALGHTKISTTESYLDSLDQNAVDEINMFFDETIVKQ